jgi:hypothetical protein
MSMQEATAMRKRYLFAGIGLVGVVVVALLVYAIRSGEEKCFSEELVRALPRGSSQEEIERSLGIPLAQLARIGGDPAVPTSRKREWHPKIAVIEESGFTLLFDEHGRFTGRGGYNVSMVDQSLLTRIQLWVRRFW